MVNERNFAWWMKNFFLRKSWKHHAQWTFEWAILGSYSTLANAVWMLIIKHSLWGAFIGVTHCVVLKPFTTWSNFLEIMINHWPTTKTNTTYVISGHQRLTFGSQINQPPTCSLDVGVAMRKSILAHTAIYLKIRIIHVEVIKTDNLILIMTENSSVCELFKNSDTTDGKATQSPHQNFSFCCSNSKF